MILSAANSTLLMYALGLISPPLLNRRTFGRITRWMNVILKLP